jgi:hypothetical protein
MSTVHVSQLQTTTSHKMFTANDAVHITKSSDADINKPSIMFQSFIEQYLQVEAIWIVVGSCDVDVSMSPER